MQALDVTYEQIEAAVTRVRHQYRRRLHRSARPRVPDPQCRADQAPRRPARHGRGLPAAVSRCCCVRSPPSISPPASSAAMPDTRASRPSSCRFRSSRAPTRSRSRSQIEAALQAIQRTLPAGISATNVQFRQATFIETSMDNLKRVLRRGSASSSRSCSLVFLMNVRATFISLTAIPISVLMTLIVFQAFGLTINTMTLGGLAIAIGALVDDAVVDVENILRRLKENRARPRPPAGPGGDRRREPGGPLRHPLCDDHHRARLPARCSLCPASKGGCSRRSASPTSSRSSAASWSRSR